MLVYVKNDKVYTRVRRRGRFSIPADCARSEKHLEAAKLLAKKQLVDQLTAEGLHYVNAEWQEEGPLPHVNKFLDDAPAVPRRPEITNLGHYDRAAMDAFERAERARQAWEADEPTDMVDYRVIGLFEVPVPTHYRAHVKEARR